MVDFIMVMNATIRDQIKTSLRVRFAFAEGLREPFVLTAEWKTIWKNRLIRGVDTKTSHKQFLYG